MQPRFILLLVALLYSVTALAEDYPGRKVYPMVPVYETAKLNQSYQDVVIIDVRSPYEYQTLHINKAINIPLNSKTFAEDVEATRKEMQPIVFYCNGPDCYQSYKAVIKAQRGGVENIFAYDSGIFDWANAYPAKATLVGKTPIDKNRLISQDKLQQHLLEPEQFVSKVKQNIAILDIREPAQRGLLELFPYRQDNISLDQKDRLVKYLDRIFKTGQTLMVYDEAGNQVRWLQYYLESKGITKYYFMEGGAKNYFQAERS